VIHRRGPWPSIGAAILAWVDGFDTRRLLEGVGQIPSVEAKARPCAQTKSKAWQPDPNQMPSGNPGRFRYPCLAYRGAPVPHRTSSLFP
jgi:hypothetical protein